MFAGPLAGRAPLQELRSALADKPPGAPGAKRLVFAGPLAGRAPLQERMG